MSQEEKRIIQFTKGGMEDDQQDKLLRRLLYYKSHTHKKSEYELELDERYGVPKRKNSTPWTKYLTGLALLITLALIAYKFLTPSQTKNTPQQFAQTYIEDNYLEYRDRFRGESDLNPNKTEGYLAYRNKDYTQASEKWNQLPPSDVTSLDKLFQGISLLKTNQYQKAYEILQTARTELGSSEKWFEETEFYYVLSCILTDREAEAENIRGTWPTNSWSAREYAKSFTVDR